MAAASWTCPSELVDGSERRTGDSKRTAGAGASRRDSVRGLRGSLGPTQQSQLMTYRCCSRVGLREHLGNGSVCLQDIRQRLCRIGRSNLPKGPPPIQDVLAQPDCAVPDLCPDQAPGLHFVVDERPAQTGDSTRRLRCGMQWVPAPSVGVDLRRLDCQTRQHYRRVRWRPASEPRRFPEVAGREPGLSPPTHSPRTPAMTSGTLGLRFRAHMVEDIQGRPDVRMQPSQTRLDRSACLTPKLIKL